MLAKSSTGLIKQSGKTESAAELACLVFECVRKKMLRDSKSSLLMVINK